jgi:hypothetical protein
LRVTVRNETKLKRVADLSQSAYNGGGPASTVICRLNKASYALNENSGALDEQDFAAMKCPPHRFGDSAALLAAVLALAIVDAVFAVSIAEDSASEAAYSANLIGAWQGINATGDENPVGTDNGGFGFQTWNFAGGFHDPNRSPYGNLNHFIDGIDFPSSSYSNLGSPAFGLTNSNRAFFDHTARAVRSFAPLTVGNTLSIDFDSPIVQPLDPDDVAGFLFRLNSGGGPVITGAPLPGVKEHFGISITSGFNGNRWTVNDSVGFTDTGIANAETTSGATFEFSLTGVDSYSMKLSRLSDGQVLFARSGELKNSGAIDTLEVTLFGNGSGGGLENNSPTGEREFFFNDLQITAPALPGDFDNDGDVDGRDFLIWQRNSDVGDLNDWQANYGDSIAATSSLLGTIPEPTVCTLSYFAWPVIFYRCRSRALRSK